MITTKHKEDATPQPVSSTTVTAISHNESSAAQAVDQVKIDMSTQWQQNLINSTQPNAGNLHAGQQTVNAHGAGDPGNGGSDPSKRGDNAASSLHDIAGAVDVLRNSVLDGLDPTKDHDPTKHDDLLKSTLPSRGDLTALLGLPGSAHQIDPDSQKAAGATGPSHGRPQRPDGSGSDPLSNPDAHHNQVEGMLSEAQTWSYDYKDKQGHDHHKDMELEGQYYHESDKDLTTGGEHNVTIGVRHGKVKETDESVNPKTGETTKLDQDGNVTVTDTKTGKVKSHDMPLEPIKKDSGDHVPDEDHQTTLPPGLANQIHKEIQNEIKSQHLPTHDGDDIHVVDTDIPGTVSTSDIKGAVIVDAKSNLLTDNRNGIDGLSDTSHGGGGMPSGPNRAGPDFGGPDYAPTPQSSGREERDTQHVVKTNPTAAAQNGSGKQSDGGDQNGNDSHKVSATDKPVETAAQHAARELDDAYLSSHPDGSNKTAQSVEGTHTGHDIASVLGGAAGGHDNGAFTDLIRLAQNPAQSGLVPPPVPAGHDAIAALQLSALGDLAGHAVDAHHVDDVHAAALALPAAVHEDVSHVTAAVIDHGHH